MSESQAEAEATPPASPPLDAAAAAKAKREARKARIQAGGNERLARITKSGRGEEAETLYKTHQPLNPSARPTSPSTPTPTPTADHDNDPEEIDISTQQHREREAMIRAKASERRNQPFQEGPSGNQPGQEGIQDPFQAMMAALQGGGGSGGAGGEGQNPFEGLPFDPSQLFGMMGGGPPGSGGIPQGRGLNINGQSVQKPNKTKLDRFFDLLHSLIFVGLGLFLAGSALRSSSGRLENGQHGIKLRDAEEVEPTTGLTEGIGGESSTTTTLQKWARLGYEKPTQWEAHFFQVPDLEMFNLHGVPIFWLIISLEVMLQSTRIMIFRNRPSPSSLLYTISSYIPPQFSTFKTLIQTAASYWVLLTSLINDLALLIFTVGVTILYAGWASGAPIGFGSPLGAGLGMGEGGASRSEKVGGFDATGAGVPMPGA